MTPRGDGAERSRLPPTIVLLGFTSLFTDVGTEMIFPLLPVFLTETLRAGPTYLGLVEGAADAVSSVMKFASGALADVLPRRKPMVLFGYGLASAVRPFVALATKPWHVLAVRLADRVGKGVRSSPRDALIADAAGDRAGRAFGFHQAMDNAGAVVGPLLATTLLAAHLSIRHVFWIAAIPGAVATLLVALVREKDRRSRSGNAGSKAEAGAGRASSGLAPEVQSPIANRRLLLYLGILALFSVGNSSDAFLLLRARSLGLSTAEIPVLWSVLNLSKVVWAYVGGGWADRVPRARLIAGGWVVFALVYAGLGTAVAAWEVWALFVTYGVFYGLTEPVEKALVRDLVREDQRGRAYGAYNFVVGIAALPAGLLTGALWRAFGPATALGAGAVLAGVASMLLLAWEGWRLG
jgi:MFS family permease